MTLRRICSTRNRKLTYPNLSMDIGGDEGGVCMDPAMAGVKAPLAQCAAAAL